MNTVFVLIGKERYMDAVPHVLTAVTPNDIERVYDLSEKMISMHDNLDMLLHTYIDGELKEISVYNEYENDFDLVSRFENE